jgi:hypothetical protein
MKVNLSGISHDLDPLAKLIGFEPYDNRVHSNKLAYLRGAMGLIAAVSINLEVRNEAFNQLPGKAVPFGYCE